MIELHRCPLCFQTLAGAPCWHRREASDFVRCTACGLIIANPQAEGHELTQLYREAYYSEENTLQDERRLRERDHVAPLNRKVLELLRRCYPRLARPGLKLLDFGCGPGYFLHEAEQQGFCVKGIEMSQIAATFACRNLGLDVFTGDHACLARFPDAYFDVVTLFSTLEHTRAPVAVIERLAAKLKPGGVICLTVPNPACWRIVFEGARWFNITNRTHLFFFPYRTLCRLLRTHGFYRVRRPLYFGGRPGFGRAANLVQFVARMLRIGSEIRVIAEKKKDKEQP